MYNIRHWKSGALGVAALFLFLFASAGGISASGLKRNIPEIGGSRQLIVVTARDWNTVSATVRFFERAGPGSPWKEVVPACDAVTGRNGLAWGIGLHGTHQEEGPVKREGDGRAPAGVFRLHAIFGYASPAAAGITKFPYEQLTASSEGVDDVRSRYYNRVVDSSRIKDRDWKSSEAMMGPHGLYRWGIIVEHNWQSLPGEGSCIFLHIWLAPGHGTAGCTAMALPDLEAIIRRLDESKYPLLVQLPAGEYERLKGDWSLP